MKENEFTKELALNFIKLFDNEHKTIKDGEEWLIQEIEKEGYSVNELLPYLVGRIGIMFEKIESLKCCENCKHNYCQMNYKRRTDCGLGYKYWESKEDK